MFHRKRLKTELEPLQLQLDKWATRVPQRAIRFHMTMRELKARIQEHFSPWKLILNEEDLNSIKSRFSGLEKIAEDVISLITQVELLEHEIKALKSASESGTAFVKQWTEEQISAWISKSKRLGAECERDSDLSDDKRKFKDIQKNVRLTRETIERLIQADTVLTTLGDDFPTDTAPLQTALPQLQKQLENTGVSEALIKELNELLEPLQYIVNAAPPPAIDTLSRTLPDLDAWSRQLNAYKQNDINKLRRQYLKLKDEWRTAGAVGEVEALSREVTALMIDVVTLATQQRVEKIKKFDEQLTQFKKASGPTALESEFNNLQERSKEIDRHQAHKDWLHSFSTLIERFNGVAQNRLLDLQESLEGQVTKAYELLKELQQHPLSDEITLELDKCEQTLDLYKDPDDLGIESVLEGLNALDAIYNKINELKYRAEADIKDLHDAQTDFTARNSKYQKLATDYTIQLEDLAPKIANLTNTDGDSGNKSLTVAQKLQASLESELDEQESILKSKLQAHIQTVRDQLSELQEILDDASSNPIDLISLPESPKDTDTLDVFENILVSLDKSKTTLASHLDKCISLLEDKKNQYHTQLTAIKEKKSLKPNELALLERTLSDLNTEKSHTTQQKYLEHLLKQIGAAKKFIDQVEWEKQKFLKSKNTLSARLEFFRDEQLDSCVRSAWSNGKPAFDIVYRIETLIQGLSAEPVDINQAIGQLKEAEILLQRVETQAKRMEAQKLRRATSRLNLVKDENIKSNWDKLKSQLDTEDLPSYKIRSKVYKLLPE